MTLRPRTQVPELEADLVGGGSFKLSEQQPGTFQIVVFFRGHH